MARRHIIPSPTRARVPSSTDLARSLPSMPLGAAVNLVLADWRARREHTDQSLDRMSETVRRFERRLEACGIATTAEVGAADVVEFVNAHTRHGAAPQLATRHARRTALRTLFRTLRRLGLDAHDPTLDVLLPPRGANAARPLTDDEVVLCRTSAQTGAAGLRSRLAVVWALGESGAVSSEIATLRIQDLNNPAQPTTVELPGTRRHDPRQAPLTDWATLVLRRRVGELAREGATADTLLAYGGRAAPGGAQAQASVCNALRQVLDRAGLIEQADVRPASLRNWTGRCLYDSGAALEQVARSLGHRSLDAAAQDIALDWQQVAR